ncbi:uncharacterized protein LOC120148593 isoform X2 [Hibiscus syriacus]|uniref:uncharacterized protein LOC120148593 isoform X2 n=1 Tax=Hibiscus syriacus TaxID=106335 RepID=UPI001921DB44|nr:uncharacterized protein LOC120148593 isoform X2 [Hibiscus syriacus]
MPGFIAANTNHRGTSVLAAVHWIPPISPGFKVNFDASYMQAQNQSWSGMMVRNSEGFIIGACRRRAMRITSIFLAEATAAVHAVEFALDLGLQDVSLEGDERSVVKKLASTEPDRSVISVTELLLSRHALSTLLRLKVIGLLISWQLTRVWELKIISR